MTRSLDPARRATVPLVRCAVYTRKSTEEGLEQEFNSLDAQREAGEAFIASQAGLGWTCLPDRYDDGGFSGGSTDRPALRRLLRDVADGRIDMVVTYKVDRLSRSLLDFAKMMEVFEKHQAGFTAVTQQFNTATSMGRLVLNVLLSFAQFEREIISERTRDKIAATRRKGRWTGGQPVLGYRIDERGHRLQVVAAEAEQVRAIFTLYLEHEAIQPVLDELQRRGWKTKAWQTRKGHQRGGQAFSKATLYRLLTNVLYVGQVRYKTEVYPGEHAGIVELAIFGQVQQVLRRNGSSGGALVRNKYGAVLKGLLRCVPCDSAMTPTHTTRGGNKRYRYYVCSRAQRFGWHSCPSKSIPAAQIEAFVLGEVRRVGSDPALLRATVEAARSQDDARMGELEAERRVLDRDLARRYADLQRWTPRTADLELDDPACARLADVQEGIRAIEGRLARVREQLASLRRERIGEDEVERALAVFDPVWAALTPAEQGQVLRLLVRRIDYDGGTSKVTIHFHSAGIKALAAQAEEADDQAGRKERRA